MSGVPVILHKKTLDKSHLILTLFKNTLLYYTIKVMSILANFIVFEGGDGSGTSTQAALLAGRLREERPNLPVYSTCEPTDSPIGSHIRRILSGEVKAAHTTLAYLFAADRNEHLYGEDGIVSRCKRGELVISDRYTPSSIAYQGAECRMPLPRRLNREFPQPALLVYLDTPPKVALKRISDRKNFDIYENIWFQEKVYKLYKRAVFMARQEGTRVVELSGEKDAGALANIVWDAVKKMPII
jgi:dTMP kinase